MQSPYLLVLPPIELHMQIVAIVVLVAQGRVLEHSDEVVLAERSAQTIMRRDHGLSARACVTCAYTRVHACTARSQARGHTDAGTQARKHTSSATMVYLAYRA